MTDDKTNLADDKPDGAAERRDSPETRTLREQAAEGDRQRLGELFERYRDRLRSMIGLRLDRRVRGRVSTSDVLQETFVEATRSFEEYDAQRFPSFYLWLRKIAVRRVNRAHRFHLGAQARDARQEVQFVQSWAAHLTTEGLAQQLLGRYTTPSQVLMRTEQRFQVQQALDRLSDLDREIIALRDFEELSNAEVAQVLGIEEATAKKRHFRAMVRLKKLIQSL